MKINPTDSTMQNEKKIANLQNSSKIQSENCRKGRKIYTLNTYTTPHSLLCNHKSYELACLKTF